MFFSFGSLTQVCLADYTSPDIIEKREFFNEDRTKSFEGELFEHLEFKKQVRIAINGKVKTIKLNLLSKEDQEYVKEMGPYVAVARDVKLAFKEAKGKAVKKGQLSITNFNYDINLRNSAGSQVDDLQIDYKIFYYIGDVKKAGSVLSSVNSTKSITLYPNMTNFLSTDKLELVKNVVKGKSGG